MRCRALTYLLASAYLITQISCDGDHAHAHTASVTQDSGSPAQATGSATSVHSSSQSSDGASNDAFASIVNTISQNPELAATLGQNPALAAAAASAIKGGYNLPPSGGYNLPPPPLPAAGQFQIPGGFGLPFGFGKGFNLNLNAGAGLGGIGAYYPIIEKAIVVVGGGILILIILALIQGSVSAGGFLHSLFGSFSKAVAGSVNLDAGPIHKSASAAAAVNINDRIGTGGGYLNDPQFNSRVIQGVDRRF